MSDCPFFILKYQGPSYGPLMSSLLYKSAENDKTLAAPSNSLSINKRPWSLGIKAHVYGDKYYNY